MFYVSNVERWLDEVVSLCGEKGLNPEDSIFVLLIFSSLDFDFVSFFRNRKSQISQYSGENVHIFTPMIFDGDVVPDGEWRDIKESFARSGIPLSNRPSAILFHLLKRYKTTGYDPCHFAGFELPSFDRFEQTLRDFVDACIRHQKNPQLLTRELGELFRAPNLAQRVWGKPPLSEWPRRLTGELGDPIDDVLHAPSVFISYSHGDKQLVIDLYNQLKNKKIKLWLDQFEVSHGDLFQQKIEQALRSSDAILTVLSRNANSSNWISFEGSYFYGQGERPIIPVVLDDEGKALADKLPFLKGRAYIDLSNPKARREGVAKLSTTLSSLRNA